MFCVATSGNTRADVWEALCLLSLTSGFLEVLSSQNRRSLRQKSVELRGVRVFLRAFYPDFIWFYAETLDCFYVLFTNNISMITKHSKIENSHKSWLFSRSKMFCYFSWPYWPAHIKQWINTYLELKPQTIKLLLIPRDIYLFSLNADCTTPPCEGEGGTRQWAVSASVKPAISQLIM